MKNERFTVIAGMICLFALIIAVLIVTVRYMHAEPWWNRVPAVTVGAQNRPPGMYTDTIILNNGGDGDAAD